MKGKYGTYIYWGITALCVIAISIFVGFIFYHFGTIKQGITKIIDILNPILYGALLAFLTAPVYNASYKGLKKAYGKLMKEQKYIHALSGMSATLLCVILVIAVLTAMVWTLIPQLVLSISDMIRTLPESLNRLYFKIVKLLADNPELEQIVRVNYNDFNRKFSSWAQTSFLPNINIYLMEFSSGIISVVRVFLSFLIGVIVMVYLLNIKTTLAAQGKKIVYALLPLKWANAFVEECRYVKLVFSQFIVGKIIDSIIIGIINYIMMNILALPYPFLISAVVGLTNIIPFFGPFVGAIPSAFIILLVSPIQCLQFLVWILILQQIDGNIIGPKILGQTTGLSSFWVLFSIILFGGLFGVAGMVIGVPTWAVFYRLVGNISKTLLKRRELSDQTKHYMDLERIDEESKEYINN
ncbi:MAG: AI-2E family transporter [Johnsonella sp.]|nr:AI-2E family transporter [Johnsonella sp.]